MARKSSRVVKTKPTQHKKYTEELSEWIQHHSASSRDSALVAFIAVKDDVEAALHAGFPVKSIWRHMTETGRTTSRYETFLRYVRSQILQAAPRHLPARTAEPSPQRQGFHFDPKPNKEDIF